MPDVEIEEIPTAMRGYDRVAVDQKIKNMSRAITESEAARSKLATSRDELRSEVSRLSGLLSSSDQRVEELTAAVKQLELRSNDAEPVSFASLGARATQIMALAEEQAADLREAAQRDVDKVVVDITAYVEARRTAAEQEAEHVIVAAGREATELRESAHSEASEMLRSAKRAAEGQIASAQREAEALRAKTQSEASERRAAIDHELDSMRASVDREVAEHRARARQEADALVAEATALKTQADLEIAEHRQRALDEEAKRHEATTARQQEVLADAEARLQEADRAATVLMSRAEQARAEADEYARSTRLEAQRAADLLVADARRDTDKMRAEAGAETERRRQELEAELAVLQRQYDGVTQQVRSLFKLIPGSGASPATAGFEGLSELLGTDASQ